MVPNGILIRDPPVRSENGMMDIVTYERAVLNGG